jgi:hypothetical protein
MVGMPMCQEEMRRLSAFRVSKTVDHKVGALDELEKRWRPINWLVEMIATIGALT